MTTRIKTELETVIRNKKAKYKVFMTVNVGMGWGQRRLPKEVSQDELVSGG